MSLDPGGHVLSSLLSILNDNNPKPGSFSTPVDLLRKVLSRDDYISVAEQLRRASDVMKLLEFALHVLRHRSLSSSDAAININRRARHLMFKIISETPVVPRSFIVTGVTMPDKRDYIGRGAYGNVFKGELRGTVVALKVLYKNDAGDNLAFCREALMWGSLKHNFVLPFMGIHEEEGGMAFLVSPYMKNGTVAQWRRNTNPSIAQMTKRMLEMARGMEYIHSEGVVHGDLRGENVLLDADLHVQIADFGLTRLLGATNTQSGAKHLNFAAPELFGCLDDDDDPSAEDPSRTQMSDVYAFGCIYYEIHYDSIPFAGRQEIQIVTLVSRGKRPPRRDNPPLSEGAWELIQQCWETEPLKRPRMKDIAEQMMGISRCVSPPTSARNDGMLQHASLSPSRSSTTPPEEDTDALLSLQPHGREPSIRLSMTDGDIDEIVYHPHNLEGNETSFDPTVENKDFSAVESNVADNLSGNRNKTMENRVTQANKKKPPSLPRSVRGSVWSDASSPAGGRGSNRVIPYPNHKASPNRSMSGDLLGPREFDDKVWTGWVDTWMGAGNHSSVQQQQQHGNGNLFSNLDTSPHGMTHVTSLGMGGGPSQNVGFHGAVGFGDLDGESISPGRTDGNVRKNNVTAERLSEASVNRRRADAPFVCTVPGCGSMFTRSFNLKGHMRSHIEDKPFVCHWPGCTKAFARQHDCKRHEALHSNYRPFTCVGCSKQFARLDALNRHLRSEGGAECAKVASIVGGRPAMLNVLISQEGINEMEVDIGEMSEGALADAEESLEACSGTEYT